MPDMEEEKDEVSASNVYQQRLQNSSVINDSVERPQPKHPQQLRSGQSIT